MTQCAKLVKSHTSHSKDKELHRKRKDKVHQLEQSSDDSSGKVSVDSSLKDEEVFMINTLTSTATDDDSVIVKLD